MLSLAAKLKGSANNAADFIHSVSLTTEKEAVESAWLTTTDGGESLNLIHQRQGRRRPSLLE
jgi:hypothetical protein